MRQDGWLVHALSGSRIWSGLRGHQEIAVRKEFIYFSHTVDGIVKAGQFRGQFRSNEWFRFANAFSDWSLRQRIQLISLTRRVLLNAAQANISSALLVSAPIVAEDQAKQNYLIKADELFLNESFDQIKTSEDPENKDSRQFRLGSLNADKTAFVKLVIPRIRRSPFAMSLTMHHPRLRLETM